MMLSIIIISCQNTLYEKFLCPCVLMFSFAWLIPKHKSLKRTLSDNKRTERHGLRVRFLTSGLIRNDIQLTTTKRPEGRQQVTTQKEAFLDSTSWKPATEQFMLRAWQLVSSGLRGQMLISQSRMDLIASSLVGRNSSLRINNETLYISLHIVQIQQTSQYIEDKSVENGFCSNKLHLSKGLKTQSHLNSSLFVA